MESDRLDKLNILIRIIRGKRLVTSQKCAL